MIERFGVNWGVRNKLFALMGSMMLGLLLSTLLVLGILTNRAAKQRIMADLHSTRQQFEALQGLRYRSLRALSRILGTEYALRNAVATYDPPTILSAMQGLGGRIQNDFFLITDDQGKLLVATGDAQTPGVDLSAIQDALNGEETLDIWHVRDRLYHVVTQALKAGPDILGTLSIGYVIDSQFLSELQTVTGSSITLLKGEAVVASTWPMRARAAFITALAQARRRPSSESVQSKNAILSLHLHGETYLSLVVPLSGPQQKQVGVYILQKSLDQELASLHRLQRTLLVTGLFAVAVALALSFIISQGVTAPVEKLVQGAEAVGRGDYGHRVMVNSHDELGMLAQAYNAMVEQIEANVTALHASNAASQQQAQALQASLRKVELLEQMKTHLGKFVPESVKRIIEKAPEAPELEKRDRDVTVLFLDIANYTRLSEHNSREHMNTLVEGYFSSFLDAIYEHNGDINETAGDGLMIIFQDEDPRQHAINAVRTALTIQQQVRDLNRVGNDTAPITVNIGINSGIAAVGSTRFEGMTGERWTYTASGPVTNIAARLAEIATQGNIYVGEETAERAGNLYDLKSLGKSQVKNVQTPIAVFEVDVQTLNLRQPMR